MGRMRGISEEPTGFRYIPSLLSEDQERDLLDRVLPGLVPRTAPSSGP